MHTLLPRRHLASRILLLAAIAVGGAYLGRGDVTRAEWAMAGLALVVTAAHALVGFVGRAIWPRSGAATGAADGAPLPWWAPGAAYGATAAALLGLAAAVRGSTTARTIAGGAALLVIALVHWGIGLVAEHGHHLVGDPRPPLSIRPRRRAAPTFGPRGRLLPNVASSQPPSGDTRRSPKAACADAPHVRG
jgi:hypothetical protein